MCPVLVVIDSTADYALRAAEMEQQGSRAALLEEAQRTIADDARDRLRQQVDLSVEVVAEAGAGFRSRRTSGENVCASL